MRSLSKESRCCPACSEADEPFAVNIEIMRTFVRLRRFLESNAELVRKLEILEEKYDEQFAVVFQAIREIMRPPVIVRRRIGF